MKNIKRFLPFIILFLMISFPGISFSQQVVDLENPAFLAKYANFDFQGKFAVQVLNDETNNYFLADFNQFSTYFEKIYFINLVFGNGYIVNLEPNLKSRNIWFLANKKYPAEKVLTDFLKMKAETTTTCLKMTDTEKENWMKSNNKYQ